MKRWWFWEQRGVTIACLYVLTADFTRPALSTAYFEDLSASIVWVERADCMAASVLSAVNTPVVAL